MPAFNFRPSAVGRPLAFAPVLVAAALVISAARSEGAVVLLKGASKPLVGYLVRQDAKTLVLREELPGGKSRETTVARDQIDELIVTVAPERLAALIPSRPELYREYAEELAEKRRDPEARDTAIRLYHLAAVLGDEGLRRGALRGLMDLARTPDEARRWRAAAYLFDPLHDPAILAEKRDATPSPPADDAARRDLLRAVRLLRQEKGVEARPLLDRPDVRRQAALLAGTIRYEELLAASSGTISDTQLARLLRAERMLSGPPAAAEAEARAGAPGHFARELSAGRTAPLWWPSLATLTEFDAAATVCRGGKWVRP